MLIIALILFLLSPTHNNFTTEAQQDTTILYLTDINSESVTYTIVPDSSRASFGIYSKGFNTKKLRDKAKAAQAAKNKTKAITPGFGPAVPGLVNFYSTSKPTVITSLSDVKYISEQEFRENELKYLKEDMYIIHKAGGNKYLKWKVHNMPYE